MKLSVLSSKTIAAAGLGLALTLGNSMSYAQDVETRTYEVSVTNITGANQFTPVLAVTHSRRVSLFTLGNSPRRGLAILAEGGDTSSLQNELSTNPEVGVAQTFTPEAGPLTFAGTTLSFTIETPADARYLSLASMILPTNDSFVGLDTVSLPSSGSAEYVSPGYDAGSEANDELCASIPGPTCGGDGAFSGFNGEGFVHIGRGIHGIGDLSPAKYDWRNPAAKVVVTRVN